MDLYDIRKKLSMGISLSSIKLKVTYYSRVSTDTNEQKKSLKNQVEHFDEMIKSNPNWTYVQGYVDDGITGTSDVKRDNFMRMIDDARCDKFDLIITKEISRFSRNTLDSIKYTRELLSHGVAVLFVNDNINTALPDSELRLTIMASMAQDEIRRLSERVKFGMNRAIQRGEILGNDLLYGYKKDKETGVLNIIDEEAKVVRRIYELYAIDEYSLSKIKQELNNENLRTCQNKKWCISTISRMIANPKYKGYYCGRKTEILDYMTKKVRYFDSCDWIVYEDKKRIPPIIDEELWERANNRLTTRKKAFYERKNDKAIYQNRYLYSAKIFCCEHNVIFHRRVFRKNHRDISWVCSEYLIHGKKTCDSPNIREKELDTIFEDLISKLKINFNDICNTLIDYYKYQEDETIYDEINKIEKEINNICLKKDKILELNIQNNLSNEEFYKRNNEYNSMIDELNKKLIELKNSTNKIIKTKKLKRLLKNKINSKTTLNKIISLLLDHIVVSKIENNKNNIKLNIFLSYKEIKNQKLQPFFRNNYYFKRGYDISCTKRYEVHYEVDTYFDT